MGHDGNPTAFASDALVISAGYAYRFK